MNSDGMTRHIFSVSDSSFVQVHETSETVKLRVKTWLKFTWFLNHMQFREHFDSPLRKHNHVTYIERVVSLSFWYLGPYRFDDSRLALLSLLAEGSCGSGDLWLQSEHRGDIPHTAATLGQVE